MKKIFFIHLSMLVCMFAGISDAMAGVNCTQNVPAGKYCKTAGTKPDCPVGCYCTGSKTAVGTSINVAQSCAERTNETTLRASGIFFCPAGTTSQEGAKTVNDCYTIGGQGVCGQKPCAPGCFCVNNGQMSGCFGASYCSSQSQPISCGNDGYGRVWRFKSGASVGILSCPHSGYATYYVDEFSDVYMGDYGIYGIIGGELIVMPFHPNYGGYINNSEGIYQCPVSYPNSALGAKTVYECFKYDANGNKVYYGANTDIICAEGFYLPANATQCVACNAALNQICPGGRFEKSSVIQGLKVNCNSGQYLPANATQCSACDDNYYFCYGGVYNFNTTEDQGLVLHNGYISTTVGTKTKVCPKGNYIPANSTECTNCKSGFACPGGIFFTGRQYDFDRGAIACTYGMPNNLRTMCIVQNTKPSVAKVQMVQQMTQQEETISLGGKDTDLETAKAMISAGIVQKVDAKQTTQTVVSSAQQADVSNSKSVRKSTQTVNGIKPKGSMRVRH